MQPWNISAEEGKTNVQGITEALGDVQLTQHICDML